MILSAQIKQNLYGILSRNFSKPSKIGDTCKILGAKHYLLRTDRIFDFDAQIGCSRLTALKAGGKVLVMDASARIRKPPQSERHTIASEERLKAGRTSPVDASM